MGAPGVGTWLAICVPLACALVKAPLSVIPVPDTCAPPACANVSGAVSVMLGPAFPRPLPPKAADATIAVSWFAPLSIVIV